MYKNFKEWCVLLISIPSLFLFISDFFPSWTLFPSSLCFIVLPHLLSHFFNSYQHNTLQNEKNEWRVKRGVEKYISSRVSGCITPVWCRPGYQPKGFLYSKSSNSEMSQLKAPSQCCWGFIQFFILSCHLPKFPPAVAIGYSILYFSSFTDFFKLLSTVMQLPSFTP